MAKELRENFLRYIKKKWHCYNTYDTTFKNLEEKSGVYVFTVLSLTTKTEDIIYVGSTTNLLKRYNLHKIPDKVRSFYNYPIFYFLELKRGFYDYEIKLIQKLKPEYNVQHKKN